ELRSQRSDPRHLVNLNGLTHALDPRRSQTPESEVPIGQPARLFADDDRPSGGEALKPRRQARRVTDRHVVGVEVILSDRAYDDLSSVHADADLEVHTLLGPQLLRVPTDLLLHEEGSVEGAPRMILVGDRRAEQREDAVARGLCDVPLVVVYRIDHELE